jgi:cytochrome c556
LIFSRTPAARQLLGLPLETCTEDEAADLFTAAAERVVAAADQRDYPAARCGLEEVAARCAGCHEGHR